MKCFGLAPWRKEEKMSSECAPRPRGPRLIGWRRIGEYLGLSPEAARKRAARGLFRVHSFGIHPWVWASELEDVLG